MHIGITNYPQLSLLSAYLKHSQQGYYATLSLSIYLSISRHVLAILSYPLSNSLASFLLALKMLKLKTPSPQTKQVDRVDQVDRAGNVGETGVSSPNR